MTGTNLDLLPFLIQPIQWLTLAILALLIWILWKVLRKPWRWWWRLAGAAVPLGLLWMVFLQPLIEGAVHQRKLSAAMKVFESYCKNAGVKIYKKVEPVDGIVLMQWRMNLNQGDQFLLDDPYGQTCSLEDCIERLVRVTQRLDLDPHRELEKSYGWANPYIGYRFVETKDPRDGFLYRYERRVDNSPNKALSAELVKTRIDHITAKYGIDWEDISTLEDRRMWIAGSSLKILDMERHEVLAERRAFMVSRSQGRNVYRTEWSVARRSACGGAEVPPDQAGFKSSVSATEMRDLALRVVPSH